MLVRKRESRKAFFISDLKRDQESERDRDRAREREREAERERERERGVGNYNIILLSLYLCLFLLVLLLIHEGGCAHYSIFIKYSISRLYNPGNVMVFKFLCSPCRKMNAL